MGAHPTACYPFYAYDRPHTALYYEAARKGADVFAAEYLDIFVHGVADHADYLARIGGEATRTRLASWSRDPKLGSRSTATRRWHDHHVQPGRDDDRGPRPHDRGWLRLSFTDLGRP